MKRSVVLLLVALLVCPHIIVAQSNPLEKKLETAQKLFNEGSYEKADEYLVKLLDKNPDFGAGWDMLVSVRGAEYEQARKNPANRMQVTVSTKNKDGSPGDKAADSMGQRLADMINAMSPTKMAWSKFMYTMRKGLLQSQDAYRSSMMWRKLNVDVDVDSNVSRKALKFYEKAEEEYEAKNYHSAALLYRRAIDEQPDFYKAKLYLGDALYASENYADAMVSFKEGVRQFPDQLEPHKYLTDAYAKSKLYDQSLEEAINTMSVYPDVSMLSKLDDAAYLNNKKIDIKWTPRAVFPNKMAVKEEGALPDLNVYSEKEDKEKPSEPWNYYVAALEKAKPYTNAKGIITNSAQLGGAKYLEVYSWQEMLKASKDPILDEARRMQAAGYLDCYVLVSCYHPDIYDQYRHFAAANKEKISRYYHAFLKDL